MWLCVNEPVQYGVQRGSNAANTNVVGMLVTGMDACDNVSCSTSLRIMLYKEAITLQMRVQSE